MPRQKDTVRKAFMMKQDLEPKLLAYCEKMGFTQSQVLNLAVRQFFENEDLKSWLTNSKPEDLAQAFMSKYQETMSGGDARKE